MQSARRFFSACFALAGLALQVSIPDQAHAETVNVAVAANFTAPMEQIAARFTRDTGHRAILSFGATGALFAQISNGAPFAVFLSADETTPEKLLASRQAVAGSAFTYAIGKLVLWSPQADRIDSSGQLLTQGQFDHIAIANPDTAPYGKAALEVLAGMQLLDKLRPRLVTGNNIAQAFQFVSSGNAELGFVALSQVYRDGKISNGSGWIIPADRYTPIRQNAVLLNKGSANVAAQALLDYLRSAPAKTIIAQYGYGL